MITMCHRSEIVNPNVPDTARIIAHWHTMSGEIAHTIYIDSDLYLWKVTDWKGDKPQPCTLHTVCTDTGLTPLMVEMYCIPRNTLPAVDPTLAPF